MPDRLPKPSLVLWQAYIHDLRYSQSSATAFFATLHGKIQPNAGKLCKSSSLKVGLSQKWSSFQVNPLFCSQTYRLSQNRAAKHSHVSAEQCAAFQGLSIALLYSTAFTPLYQAFFSPAQWPVKSLKRLLFNKIETQMNANSNHQRSPSF